MTSEISGGPLGYNREDRHCLFEAYVVRASNVQLMVDGWAIFTVLRVMLGSKRRS